MFLSSIIVENYKHETILPGKYHVLQPPFFFRYLNDLAQNYSNSIKAINLTMT